MSTGYTSIDTTKGKLQNDPNANFKNTSTDINDIDDDKVSNDDEFPILINTVSQLNIFLRNFPLPSTTSAPAEPLPLKKTPEQIPYPPTSAPTSAPTSEPAPTSATSNPNTNELILHLSKYTSVKDNKLQSEYDRIKNTGNNNGLTDDKLTVDLFKLLSDNIKNVDFTIYNVLNDVDRVAAPTVIYLNSSIDDLYTILKHTNKTPINQSDNPTPKSSIESGTQTQTPGLFGKNKNVIKSNTQPVTTLKQPVETKANRLIRIGTEVDKIIVEELNKINTQVHKPEDPLLTIDNFLATTPYMLQGAVKKYNAQHTGDTVYYEQLYPKGDYIQYSKIKPI